MLKLSKKKKRLICHIIGLSPVGMDFDQRVYVLLSVLGEKIPVFFCAAKYFSGFSTGKGTGTVAIFYHQSSLLSQAIKLVC